MAQPQASFGGEYVHESIYEMAAAYGFHICNNHPLTALVAIYSFLFVNGYRLQADRKSLYAVMIDLANGKVEKKELATFLKENVKKRDSE